MANSTVQEPPAIESSIFLMTAPAKPKDRRLALIAISFSLLFFAAAVPFARLQLPEVSAFIPTYESALLVSDLITAVLLFAQFSILRLSGVLILACGYLFSALIAVSHMLTFPGLFSLTGMLGAGPQSTAWLYMFWHGVFPLAVVTYALLKGDARATSLPDTFARRVFLISVVGVVAAVVTLTSLSTIGQTLLPNIMQGNTYTSSMILVISTVWMLSAVALVVLWLRRPHTMLDLWLMVVMCAWIFDIGLSAVFNAGRFDLGFYAGRIYGLLAATFVLVMLLLETGALYAQLARLLATEQRKREVEERHRIFDISVDLILVTDQHGDFIRVSPSSATLLGYDPEEMIGHSTAEFIYPDDLEPTREEMRLARRGRQTRSFETRYLHKDKRLVTLAWTGAWSEPAQQHLFIGRDITASKIAYEAMLESERMAQDIIAGALDGFVQVNETGEVTEWNPQAEVIFGWSRQEALGKPLNDLFLPPGYQLRSDEMIARLRNTDEGVKIGERFEYEAVRKDGRKIKVETALTALRRRDGYVFNGFVRDLTEKIAAEEQLKQAQKMESVGQLTGGIAHDFNNMLTVITGTIDILADGVAEKPRLAAIAKLISEAADRGAELTGHLLAFARKQPLQPRETDINALMVETGKLLHPTLGEHIEIETVLKTDVSSALVDPNQLSSALLNLAINARDAMPNGGKLMLETGNAVLDHSYAKTNPEVQPGNYVLIAVSDTGGGIPKEIRDKVFEPFFTTKEVGKGTGLGLSMVYGFVKQSGGHIKVYSEEGYGTTFKIYLPRAGAQAAPVVGTALDAEIEGGNETILVVEDDALVRTSVTAQIQGLGYRTLTAANAAEALAIADDGATFDLLFTDVIMPGKMNGRQLAEEMAKRHSPLKVLFTSGYTEDAVIHHGRLDRGVLLLAKPYRKLDLARMLRRALDGSETVSAPVDRPVRARAS
ncbi:MAG: PAS domain S-box protein [Xanthobacteraceae bacterium]